MLAFIVFNFCYSLCRHCTEPVFGAHQWEILRTKLASWRVNYFASLIYYQSLFRLVRNQGLKFITTKGADSSHKC